ncbi:MAG: RsmE family RNA methyltransferase [bacterium]|nr:RsmE family RNA methyltransferase [bacterium]
MKISRPIHRRFFIKPENITQENVELRDKDDIQHIHRVLKLKEKDNIVVLDGSGYEYSVVITSIAQNIIKGKIVETIIHPPTERQASQIELTLVQALPKLNKMDLIISKCTELGVTRIIPAKTRRSIVNLTDESKKLSRWQRIAKASSSQSMRLEIPIINPITDISTSLELIGEVDLGLIFYENATTLLRTVLSRYVAEWEIPKKDCLRKLAIFIGPEGGFAHQEVIQIEAKGFIPVSLGPNLLRCETAPIVALSILLYELGVIG